MFFLSGRSEGTRALRIICVSGSKPIVRRTCRFIWVATKRKIFEGDSNLSNGNGVLSPIPNLKFQSCIPCVGTTNPCQTVGSHEGKRLPTEVVSVGKKGRKGRNYDAGHCEHDVRDKL